MTNGNRSLLSSDVPSLLTIAFKFGDWLNILLQFWIVINVAIIGWLLTTKPLLSNGQKLIVTVVYLLIMLTNLVWILHIFGWLKKILSEINAAILDVKFDSKESNIQPIIKSASKNTWWVVLFIAHGASDFFVGFCIWYLTNNQK
jgi:hypothetical protein